VVDWRPRGDNKRRMGIQQGPRNSKKASSSSSLVAPTHMTHEAWEVGHIFHECFLDAMKREVEEVEAVVREQRLSTPDI